MALLGAVIAGSLPVGQEPTAAETTVAIHRAFWFATLVSVLAVVSAFRIPAGLPADLAHREQGERAQEIGARQAALADPSSETSP